VVYRAILAGSVTALQYDQQGTFTLRVHQVLQIVKFLVAGFDFRECVPMGFMLVFEAGVDLAQIDLRSGSNAKPLAVAHSIDLLFRLLYGEGNVDNEPFYATLATLSVFRFGTILQG
jgi:hypothetical protein